ncbi:MAG: hypothetical protein GEU99_05525 [Luteitalea sp.]|nr:hypothetical protein [Luteitalea sp.]
MTLSRVRIGVTSVLLAVVALKVAALAIDPTIRLFLGDSAAYLNAAADNWLPPERSFVYPVLIKALVFPTGSLWTLLFWQTLAGLGVALLLWLTLVRRLALPRGLALAAACVLAIEPAQLFYERMVMAETLGLLAFAGFFASCGVYLAHGRAAWLPLTTFLGLLAVSIRLNYLPVVAVISLALPLLRGLDPVARPGGRRLLAHSLLALCAFFALHGTYRHAVGRGFKAPPGYIARVGFMRLGLVAPLIKPEHFVRVGLPADFAEHLTHNLANPDTRPSQFWAVGGLADAIAQRGLDVDRVGLDLATLAVADDPFGLVRLGVHTLGNYFRPPLARLRLDTDLARAPDYPDALVQKLRARWRYDIAGLPQRITPISRYFEVGSWWLVACLFLLAPLAALNLALHWRDPRRTQILLGALVGVGLVMTHVLFSSIASYRYLHGLPFFTLVNLLPLLSRKGRGARDEGPGQNKDQVPGARAQEGSGMQGSGRPRTMHSTRREHPKELLSALIPEELIPGA